MSMVVCIFNVSDNNFTDNRANISGGAVYYDLYQPNGLLQNSFKLNQAQYGPNFASYPAQLKLMDSNTEWTQAFASGRDV